MSKNRNASDSTTVPLSLFSEYYKPLIEGKAERIKVKIELKEPGMRIEVMRGLMRISGRVGPEGYKRTLSLARKYNMAIVFRDCILTECQLAKAGVNYANSILAYCHIPPSAMLGIKSCSLFTCYGVDYAQVSWIHHGETGRLITAWKAEKNSPITYRCGCFTGDKKSLLEYIEIEGFKSKRAKNSRLIALSCLDEMMEFSRVR